MAMKKPLVRGTGALLLGATIAFGNVAPAQAFFWLLDPNVAQYLDHLHTCKILGFTDPAEHVRQCNPKFVKFISVHEDDDGGAQPPPPPPPTPIPPTCETDESYCEDF